VTIKAFFVDALTSALELGIARPEDVLAHVTPDVLAQQLPRPLWARLLTACLGAPRVDAQLVIETIGIPNLCEHIPSQLIWACLGEIGQRALGKQPEVAAPAPTSAPATRVQPQRPLTAPPPDVVIAAPRPTPPPMTAVGPEIPAPASAALADLINELEASEPPAQPARGRTPTAQRFRTSNTGIGRLGSAQRRPQVAAQPATSATRPARRSGTEVSDEPVDGPEIAVDDSQLVDWSTNEQTQATDDDFGDIGRKR
jgi:hypothetical protein